MVKKIKQRDLLVKSRNIYIRNNIRVKQIEFYNIKNMQFFLFFVMLITQNASSG
jgi:hypothetical protein